jgi:DUF3078 family protein
MPLKKIPLPQFKGGSMPFKHKSMPFRAGKKGAFGTIGANLSDFSNWNSKRQPNSSVGNIRITVNVFANLQQEKFFWKNSGNVNLAWVKFDDKDNDTDDNSCREAT